MKQHTVDKPILPLIRSPKVHSTDHVLWVHFKMKKMNTDLLFSAECNGVMVAVKFVHTSYGQVVHELLARSNQAPKLYSVSPLA